MFKADTRFGCSLITLEGRIVAVDDPWCAFLKRSREDTVGRSFLDHVAPDHRDLSWQCYQDILRTGRGMLIKGRLLDSQPAPLAVDISVSVLPATGSTSPLICSLYVPVSLADPPPRAPARREELISTIGILASQLRGLTAEHQLPFLSSLLDMVALECRTTPERSLQ